MIFNYFSQNESVSLKIDSCTSKRNKQTTHTVYMSYDCNIGGFLEATLVWIHSILQNLCRTQSQWPRVANNIDPRDNMFVYSFVTLPLKVWVLSSCMKKHIFFHALSQRAMAVDNGNKTISNKLTSKIVWLLLVSTNASICIVWVFITVICDILDNSGICANANENENATNSHQNE